MKFYVKERIGEPIELFPSPRAVEKANQCNLDPKDGIVSQRCNFLRYPLSGNKNLIFTRTGRVKLVTEATSSAIASFMPVKESKLQEYVAQYKTKVGRRK